jgi:glycosyltransferase involved in cell wall biosynthesis
MTIALQNLPQVAIVLHLFHLDLWPLFKQRLLEVPVDSDLYITTPDYLCDEVRRMVLTDLPNAQIFGFENRGRDVGPLIQLLKFVPLHRYELVLKIHSKKSTHRVGSQGDAWRDDLLNGLLPTGRTHLILDYFANNKKVGIAGPDLYLTPLAESFYHPDTITHWNHLTQTRTKYPADTHFFAGTMFWARGSIFLELAKLNINQSNFEIESGQLDGTLAHALERYFPILAFDQDLSVAGFNFSDARSWASQRTLSAKQIEKISQYSLHSLSETNVLVVIKKTDKTPSEKVDITVTSLKLASAGVLNVNTEVLLLSNQPRYSIGLNKIIRTNNFDWLLFANAGDEFTQSGLLIFLSQTTSIKGLNAAYTDKLIISPSGSIEAALLPDFDSDLLLSFPWLMSNHWLFNRNTLNIIGAFNEDIGDFFELEYILRLIKNIGLPNIHHTPEPLLITSEPNAFDAESIELDLLNQHIQAIHSENSQVVSIKPRIYRALYSHSSQPLVTIIVRNEDLISTQACIESLLEFTNYKNFEIIIIEPLTVEFESSEWLKGFSAIDPLRFRVINVKDFQNLAYASNQAASFALGSHLIFIENSTRFIEPFWLTALLNHALRIDVGVVGAKVINSRLLIEQSGVILGLHGTGEQAFKGDPWDSSGYMQRLNLDQNFNAISSDCFIISKQIFSEVNGFDKSIENLKLNHIDFCLRIRSKNIKVIWTAHSVVGTTHSRPKTDLGKSANYFNQLESFSEAQFLKKWLPTLAKDSAYNSNFTLIDQPFTIEPDAEITFRPLSKRSDPIVLIHPSDNSGCGHYRLMQPLRSMENAGLVDGICTRRPLLPVELEKVQPDTIVFQKPFETSMLQYMKHSKTYSNAFKIFEIDDLIHKLPLTNPDRKKFPPDLVRKFRDGVSIADKLIVSTQGLADSLHDWHHYIQILELKLPTHWWLNLELVKSEHKKPRVGWAGGSSHRADLELLFDVVKTLANEVDWIFLGMCPDKFRPFIKELHYGVAIDAYPQKLASLNLDLALAPLENSPFNDCKSNLRLLEYGACGYPVICSDTRAYIDSGLPVQIVKNRYKDWLDAIRHHIYDLPTSNSLGNRLKEEVHKKWMLRNEALVEWADAWHR